MLLKKINSFKRNPEGDIIQDLEQLLAYQAYKRNTNCLQFFRLLGRKMENLRLGGLKNPTKKTVKHFLTTIKPGQCHNNSVLYALKNKDCYFFTGFCDVYHRGYNLDYYHSTIAHSFLVYTSEEKPFLLDPTISAVNFSKQKEYLTMGKNYFGVYIPTDIVSKIVLDGKRGTPLINISHYLKNEIFSSSIKTDEFIGILLPYKENVRLST